MEMCCADLVIKKLSCEPAISASELTRIHAELSLMSNGRFVHRVGNYRQALGFYIELVKRGQEFTEEQLRNLEATVREADELIEFNRRLNAKNRESWWSDGSSFS